MKRRILLLLLVALALSGCGVSESLLKKIPNNEFKTFEYHRVSGGSSADIVATNSHKSGDEIIIESLDVKESWPLSTFSMKVEGYKRKIEQ